jgi:branched-chain amino acid transport system permease protein
MIQFLFDSLSLGSLYALIALGIALIFGIMRLINFAFGEIIMVAAYGMLLLSGLPLPAFFLGTVVLAAAFAVATEWIAFRPLRNADPATLLVTSFAVSYLVQHLAVIFSSAEAKAVVTPPSWSASVEILGATVGKIEIATTLAAVLLMAGLTAVLRFTDIGLHMRAAAEDFRMARVLGVRAQRVITVAFAISGVLAGVGAFLYIAKVGTFTPHVGLPLLLPGVVASVLGGLRSLLGAVLGGYLLGMLTVALQVVLPAGLAPFRDALLFSLVIVILLFRPDGMLGGLKERV